MGNGQVRIYSRIPAGWSVIEDAANAPRGYEFICNNKDPFTKAYRQGLIRTR